MSDAPESVDVDGITYVRAYPVADHRCPHCGSGTYGRYWTPARLIQSVRDWHEQHGVAPSRTLFGESGEHDKPTLRTIDDMFGRRAWLKVTKLAGVPRPKQGAPSIWSREQIIEALLDWLAEHGRWPQKADWSKSSPTNPHFSQVVRKFGRWNLGLRAAGHASLRLTPEKIGRSSADAIADVLRAELAIRPLNEVAAEIGVDPTYLSRIARGVSGDLRTDYADRILTALDHPHLLEAATVAA